MDGVYPFPTCAISVGDVQFKRQSRSSCFACSQSQVSPPFRTESIFRSVRPRILGVVLVVIDHSTEACIPECFHIGDDALVGSLLITEEPPRLHTIFCRRIAPQPFNILGVSVAFSQPHSLPVAWRQFLQIQEL